MFNSLTCSICAIMQMAGSRCTYCLIWDLSSGSIWLAFFTFPKVYVYRGADFGLEEKSV
jgi:hypothetical protein